MNQSEHLNTPRLVADATGTTVWRWDQQEPFGDSPADQNPSSIGTFDLPLRLPGQYADKETGLSYNYYRDYDPVTGRYVQSDPIGLLGGSNPYVYGISNPFAYADPDGTVPPAYFVQFLPRSIYNQLVNILPYINNPVQAQQLVRAIVAANQYRIAANIAAAIAIRAPFVVGAGVAGVAAGQKFNEWFERRYCQPFGGAIYDILESRQLSSANACKTGKC